MNGRNQDRHGMVVHTMQNGNRFFWRSTGLGLVSTSNDIYILEVPMDVIRYITRLD